jgi:hypothetical protein
MVQTVVELSLGTVPSPSGSGELLLVDEWSCRLVFVPIATTRRNWPETAIATFSGCQQAVFGYPNDEAQRGHPEYGDLSYGFYEVRDSEWPRRLEAFNRRTFPDATSGWDRVRHFVVICHEDLVEVLADDVAVEIHRRPFAEVAQEALRRNLDEHLG